MKDSTKFYIVVNFMYGFTIIAYLLIATIGYASFGLNSKENIVNNFNQNLLLTKAMYICIIFTTSTKFILAMYPLRDGLIDILMNLLFKSTNNVLQSHSSNSLFESEISSELNNEIETEHDHDHDQRDDISVLNINHKLIRNWLSFIIRSFIPIIIMLLSLILPNFIQLMSIVGALFVSFISFIIPICCYLQIFYSDLNIYEFIGLLFVLIIGIILAILSLLLSH